MTRADCPDDGVHTARMPWEVRPNSHLAALSEAREGTGRSVVETASRLCDQPGSHSGDRSRVLVVTRDMAEAYSAGVAAEMPQAAQTVDRFHVMQLFSRTTDKARCRERRAMLAGTKYVWLKWESNLTERQLAKKAELEPGRSHPGTARACQMTEAMRDVYELPGSESAAEALDRLFSWMTHSNVPEMKVVARTLRKEREGVPD